MLRVHGGCFPGERGQSRWGLAGRRQLILLCVISSQVQLCEALILLC